LVVYSDPPPFRPTEMAEMEKVPKSSKVDQNV